MRAKITTAILLLFCFCGCDEDNMILELKDIQHFQALEEKQGSVLQISGLAFHSALAVEKMTTKKEGNNLIVELHLVRAQKGLSGSFSYKIPVPEDATSVLFGKARKEIWRRS